MLLSCALEWLRVRDCKGTNVYRVRNDVERYGLFGETRKLKGNYARKKCVVRIGPDMEADIKFQLIILENDSVSIYIILYG